MTQANGDDRSERRIPFVGITNLRDLGGYPAAGGTTRWGRMFRSDALHKLTTDDLVDFQALGVRTVFDLRGDAERTGFPGRVESVHVPIAGRPVGATPPPPPADMSAADGEQMLRDMYVGILEYSSSGIGTVVRAAADADRAPMLFHCHGGKDRTGVVAMVVLRALGVDCE